MNQAHRRYLPPAEPPRESLAGLLLGGAGIVLLLIALAVILPLFAP
jgi:hypothetical protein